MHHQEGGYFINYNLLAGFIPINYISFILVSVDWLTLPQLKSILVSVLAGGDGLWLLQKCTCWDCFLQKLVRQLQKLAKEFFKQCLRVNVHLWERECINHPNLFLLQHGNIVLNWKIIFISLSLWSCSSFSSLCALFLILNFCDMKADYSKSDLHSFRYDVPKSSQPLYCFIESHSTQHGNGISLFFLHFQNYGAADKPYM